jgi:hypothetical protein
MATTERASGGVVGGLPGWRDGLAKQAVVEFVTRVRRLGEMAEADPELRGRQPWKAAHERDYAG